MNIWVCWWLRRQCTRRGFDPWVRKIPWKRKWQPTPYSCLGNPMDRGTWWATVPGVAESDTTEWLTNIPWVGAKWAFFCEWKGILGRSILWKYIWKLSGYVFPKNKLPCTLQKVCIDRGICSLVVLILESDLLPPNIFVPQSGKSLNLIFSL